jgi:hypothetical protein
MSMMVPVTILDESLPRHTVSVLEKINSGTTVSYLFRSLAVCQFAEVHRNNDCCDSVKCRYAAARTRLL